MRLDFRFSGRPPDSLWCEAVVVFVFQRKFLTLGLLSGLDAKMGGLLGRLEKAGFWTGTFQEDLLLASQGRIRAEKVLLCGLGPSAGCEFPCIAAEVERAGEVLAKMRVSDLAVHVPMLEGEEADYPNHLVQSAERLSAPFFQVHRESPISCSRLCSPWSGSIPPPFSRRQTGSEIASGGSSMSPLWLNGISTRIDRCAEKMLCGKTFFFVSRKLEIGR